MAGLVRPAAIVGCLAVATVAAAVSLADRAAQQTAVNSASSSPSSTASISAAVPATAETALGRLELRIGARPDTRRSLGKFELRSGRTLRLYTVETTRGEACLVDADERSGAGSTCLENGLFGARRVAFVVNSNGGPTRFSELQVVGVAHPSVHSIRLARTDGSAVDVGLNGDRVFVYDSTAEELGHDVLPSSLELYGRSGKLIESVVIPSRR